MGPRAGGRARAGARGRCAGSARARRRDQRSPTPNSGRGASRRGIGAMLDGPPRRSASSATLRLEGARDRVDPEVIGECRIGSRAREDVVDVDHDVAGDFEVDDRDRAHDRKERDDPRRRDDEDDRYENAVRAGRLCLIACAELLLDGLFGDRARVVDGGADTDAVTFLDRRSETREEGRLDTPDASDDPIDDRDRLRAGGWERGELREECRDRALSEGQATVEGFTVEARGGGGMGRGLRSRRRRRGDVRTRDEEREDEEHRESESTAWGDAHVGHLSWRD